MFTASTKLPTPLSPFSITHSFFKSSFKFAVCFKFPLSSRTFLSFTIFGSDSFSLQTFLLMDSDQARRKFVARSPRLSLIFFFFSYSPTRCKGRGARESRCVPSRHCHQANVAFGTVWLNRKAPASNLSGKQKRPRSPATSSASAKQPRSKFTHSFLFEVRAVDACSHSKASSQESQI